MDKKDLIKEWTKQGLSADEIERKLDLLDSADEATGGPTLQEFQDRNVAVVSAVNDKVEVNSLSLATKKDAATVDKEIADLETRMQAYVDAKFSEIITITFDDGGKEDIKTGK